MKISVFGLGYVGTVSAACLASIGHEVVGVDINPSKVEMINSGQSPIIEKGLETLLKENVQAGRLRAITNSVEAVIGTDISLICVGTPSAGNGNLDLSYIERVSREIGEALLNKSDFHTIIIRSTVLPGSIEKRIIPIIETASGYRAGIGFGIVSNPEFLREGTAVDDFYHPPFTVIGQYEQRGTEVAKKLYVGIEAPLFVVPIKVAEMVKYANNSFHGLKVAFANEIGNICKQQGIDSHQVMDIFCQDHKLNLSPYYLNPGFAFGGSCLPKDIRALLYAAHRLDLRVPVLESILPSNELQVRKAFQMIQETGYKNIGLLGLSFKAGTDDLRESPMVELIEILLGKGYHIKIYDKNVSLARLYGANKAYIENTIPHIAELMCDSIDEVLSNSEVLVIGNRASEFTSVLHQVRNGQIIIDLVRVQKDIESLRESYQGICW
jgi:GDP-mannose 6-dehydrogenase